MKKKEMIAMLLAGGQGQRLGILTKNKAKPAVSFAGRYKIIDFPMSNCINSGVDTVGVLTQYQPLILNRHIGIGIPWDLDRRIGGVTVLAPHLKGGEAEGEWYSGTANAIFQNIPFVDMYDPDYVLVLAGDHVYKMDYSRMLDYHKQNNADCTIAVLEVPIEEASRFGIMNTDENNKIYEFDEKPKNPKNNLASMGIYIFNWNLLKEALYQDAKIHADSDFGKHIIPMFLEENKRLYAYRFRDYWRDVGTISTYWEANMELIRTVPDFNLYEDFWKIYTYLDHQPPEYNGPESDVKTSLVSEGGEIYGTVHSSILGTDVIVEEGAKVSNSIIMSGCVIGKGSFIDKCVIDDNCVIGKNVVMGVGEEIENTENPGIYVDGITVIGEGSVIPDNVAVGKNCVIHGATTADMYSDGQLQSGASLILAGEVIL